MVGAPAVISIVRLAYELTELLLPVVTNNEAYEPFILYVHRARQ